MFDEDDDAPPVKKRTRNRIPVALRGRGRRPRRGPKRKKKDRKGRPSPPKRPGARFHSVTLPEETYLMVKELAKFYKLPSMGRYIESIVKPAFEQAYVESMRLKRIDETRRKAQRYEEVPNDPPPPSRTEVRDSPRRDHRGRFVAAGTDD